MILDSWSIARCIFPKLWRLGNIHKRSLLQNGL